MVVDWRIKILKFLFVVGIGGGDGDFDGVGGVGVDKSILLI